MAKASGKNLVFVFKKLEAIRATASRLEKDKILADIHRTDKQILYEVLYYANHPFLNFHIRVDDVIIWNPSYNYSEPVETIWPKFRDALDQMNDGKLSGGAARHRVEELLSPLGDTMRYWFTCILNRDLKMGVASKTITKFFPDLLPDVAPMLAKALDLTSEATCSSKVGYHLEPKIDGLRVLAFIRGGVINFVSRTGKEIWNFELISDDLLALGIDNAVFDGEFFAGTFAKTISIVHTQSPHSDIKMMKYNVFDIIPIQKWITKKTDKFSVRRAMLEKVFARAGGDQPQVIMLPSEPLKKASKDYIISRMEAFIDAGHEGGMLKDPEAPYAWGRSTNILKAKPVFEGDLEIYGFEAGTGKNVGRLGAILCKGTVEFFGKEYKIDTRVGGGFSDKQRDEFWINQKGMLNTMVQVEFKEVANHHKKQSVYKLREPEFMRPRPDKEVSR